MLLEAGRCFNSLSKSDRNATLLSGCLADHGIQRNFIIKADIKGPSKDLG